jgi:hypothetical protein
MTFETTQIEAFQSLFEERKHLIRHFEGCDHLELWQDTHHPNIFFTYSKWQSEQHLNHYRFSELFKDTWAKTRALFSAAPQAWSVLPKLTVE